MHSLTGVISTLGIVCLLIATDARTGSAEETADVAAGSSAAESPEAAEAATTEAATPAGCPHAGDGPCCTSCRKKLARQAERTEPAAAEAKAECPCQRARRLAEGG